MWLKWKGSLEALKEHEQAKKKVTRRVSNKKKGGTGKKWVNYTEYLYSKWWRTKRLQKLHSAGNRCNHCGSYLNLEVHHLHYNSLGREKNRDLEVLCHDCHSKLHGFI